MRIGVLRGRENSFPEAFVAKVNSMGRGVEAEEDGVAHFARRHRAMQSPTPAADAFPP